MRPRGQTGGPLRAPRLRSYSHNASVPMKLSYSAVKLGTSNSSFHRTVIFLHGLFGLRDNWNFILKLLQQKVEKHSPSLSLDAYALDFRNHGSSPHSSSHTYPDLASDLHHFIDSENIKKAVLVGHSMGGKAAIFFALTHPDRTAALCSVDASPAHYLHNHDDRFQAMEEVISKQVRSKEAAEGTAVTVSLHSALTTSLEILSKRIESKGERAYLLRNLVVGSDSAVPATWRVNVSALRRSQDALLGFPFVAADARYLGPALFIGGTEESRLMPQYASQIPRLFPDSRIELVEGAGHFVHAQAPHTFVQHLVPLIMRSLP